MYGEYLADGVVPIGQTSVTVAFGPGSRNRTWTVSQVSVEMVNAPLGASCELRKGDRLITFLIATGDVGAGDPPIVLTAGETLTVKWSGVTPGLTGKVFVVYDDGR
jgi:hypothetical protein